jgi:hypothetical protein
LIAWTSTPPLGFEACKQLETLCGWLLPGPVSVTPVPPRETAISAAVCELPYRFDESVFACAAAVSFAPAGHVAAVDVPPVAPQVVQWPVLVDGFMPATAGDALPLCWSCPFELVLVLDWLEALVDASLFTWPGALACASADCPWLVDSSATCV